MDLKLKGARAIVTGGSRGIGLEIVRNLLSEGCSVATCARGQSGLDRLKAEAADSGATVLGEALDVRDKAAFSSWLERAVADLGGVDIVVSNVSTRPTATGDEGWREALETDLLQHVRVAELSLPHLAGRPHANLLFISSIASVLTELPPGEEAYGTMKAALINYVGQLAARQGARGVRVNAVSPGPIDFEGGFWDEIKKVRPALHASAAARSVLGRHGTPHEVADAVTFLVSPLASYITGANLRIDGGMIKSANF